LPVFGFRGARSQSASRSVVHRRLRCSNHTSATTSTNCQTKPAVKQTRRARTSGLLACDDDAIWGATIHASAAIGSAAAAQIAKIARLEYWGIVTLDRSTAGDGEGATAVVLSLL